MQLAKELTESERQEALDFYLSDLRGKTWEQLTKASKGNRIKYRDWCRISNSTPYAEEYQNALEGERQAKYLSYERIKKSEMRRKTEEFVREHLITKEDLQNVKYSIIRDIELENDEYISLWIPFDNMRYGVPRYWAGVEIYKSRNPKFFERIKQTFKVFDWECSIISNNLFYNTKAK